MIERYLANYTEPEARAFGMLTRPCQSPWQASTNTRVWQGCLVIPAFDEAFEPLHRQLASLSSADVLAILVINAPENANPKAIANTQNLLKQLHEQDYEHVIVVDRASDGLRLNPKQGVGLARKIGCDLALALRLAGRAFGLAVVSDADVVSCGLYRFAVPKPRQRFHWRTNLSAPSVQQRPYPALRRSTLRPAHELLRCRTGHGRQWLRPSQLRQRIAVRRVLCCGARLSKRSAGEGFLPLNKICKLAPVERLAGPALSIEARTSRVPFGTGPALRKIVDSLIEDPSGDGYLSYHPACFQLLGRALEALNRWPRNRIRRLKAMYQAVYRHLAPTVLLRV